ncbi:MAG: MarR family transcriptional regulator [Saprospiraceae bacterium]|nr:MarR family transcriptional regulator [Saprospiraceae bacterium]
MELEDELRTRRFRSVKHKALLNVLFSAYWLRNELNTKLKPFKITVEQFNVMRILRGSAPNPLTIKDISSRMIERASNVSRILDKLELKNYILRTQSSFDKRESSIIITAKGEQLLKKLDVIVNIEEERLSNLTDDEALLLNQLLDKIRN